MVKYIGEIAGLLVVSFMLACAVGEPTSSTEDTQSSEHEVRKCGNQGQVCCRDSTCSGSLVCNANTKRCETCGAEGQVCCANFLCNDGLACNGGVLPGTGTCVAGCGEVGQVCCLPEGRCITGASCVSGVCQ
jgi:hypothetical protein